MSRKNVLLVCVDHWPGRLMGALGHPVILTPTLDQLARNGVLFTNAYSATPTCVPARRELYTGASARAHGDRVFGSLPMPALPTMAQTFRDAGYQACAVGKMHVHPQRDRVGFDDIILNEEGRHEAGLSADDYEMFLAEQGFAGQELTHGMCNNEYMTRPWHLPEYCHPTNWAVREMCKAIRRRDPTRPAFWYCSFNHPHPPLAPLAEYVEMYRQIETDMPFMGEWAKDFDSLPYALRARRNWRGQYNENAIRLARQAFYALCTHLDHQIRLLIGMLREEKLLDDTIFALTCDHGDMLGNHGLWAKALFYEESARIPLLLVPAADDARVGTNVRDTRLAALCDVMPTLLELCDIPVPNSVEGLSLVGERRRDGLYGEHYENELATRMMHDGRHKLIYYPVGNRTQLFDLEADPNELRDVADDARYAEVRERLTGLLVQNLYGGDTAWLDGRRLVGLPDKDSKPAPNRGLNNQRGWRFM